MSVSPIHSAAKAASVAGMFDQPAKLKGLSPAEQGKAVAGQFEAIMLRQFLQDSVGNMLGGKEAGPGGNVYGYMLTDVLANKISEGGGLGLSKILQQQLTPRAGLDAAPTTAKGQS